MGGSSSKQKKQQTTRQSTRQSTGQTTRQSTGETETVFARGKQREKLIKGHICTRDEYCLSNKCLNVTHKKAGICAGGALPGINYQEKYQKYKSKYLDIKEKNNL